MSRRLIAVALAVLGLLSAASAPAGAEVTRKKAMWGPAVRDGVSQFPVYRDLGVGLWQSALYWNEVAPQRPADPRDPADAAYRWPAELDAAVADATRHGIGVSLLVMFSPPWANGGRSPRWAPTRPADFADFLVAASRRYPRVRHWMVWGEPSKDRNFQPLASDRGRALRSANQRRGPRLYARILDAAYGALKSVSRRNLVIGGNTFTIGTIAPLRYIKAMRLPDGRPPRMDLYGHNPFTLRRPNLASRPLGEGNADFSDLDTLFKSLDRAFRRATVRRQRRVPVFMSEFSLPTDHPNWEFNFYLNRRTQADWLRRALRITRSNRRLYTLGYLGLYDDPPRSGGDEVARGLMTYDGQRKPAYEAFRDS